MAHHVPRVAKSGAWVLISEGWYYTSEKNSLHLAYFHKKARL